MRLYNSYMSQNARFDEEQSTQRRARILGLSYTDTSALTNKPLFKDILPIDEMNKQRIVPLQSNQNDLTIGITTTTSQQTISGLAQRFLDQRLTYTLISDTGFQDYMKLYNPPKKVVYKDIAITDADQNDLIAQVSSTLDQVRADDMLAYLTQQAHKLSASDIHIENQQNSVRIRLRIDGVLHTIANIKPDRNRMLTSAIASAGNISTASNEAQQGHITQKVVMADGAMVDVNLRVETIPAINGMDIVMRLFNMQASMYKLDNLGLSPNERLVVEDIIRKPSGLVLAVGPTGSGKTTTLYSILNSLNNDEKKLITIEDPVEYQLNGVTQVSVGSQNSNETKFADKLRAVLRLDPDVVMIGEIRDMDTAKTALQASLTGHLVLCTFHAGSAAAALTRLMDVIGENPLFLSAIRLVMAQRLVRRLDDTCKQPYQPDELIKNKLQEIVNSLPSNIQRPDLSRVQLFKPGKSADSPYGYKGQIALREQLIMSNDLRVALQEKGTHLSTQIIEEIAVKSGMLTMLQNAMFKLISGETTVEEVFRVLG